MSGNDGNGGRKVGSDRYSPPSASGVSPDLDASGIPTDQMGDLSPSENPDAPFLKQFKLGEWMDISDEKYRFYTFPGIIIKVDEPSKLKVSRNSDGQDSHRIITKGGHGIYIARGWACIEWATHEGLDPASF